MCNKRKRPDINKEMRRRMKEEVLPEAMKFCKMVFPFTRENEIDKLDKIRISDVVLLDDCEANFSLSYDPQSYEAVAECRFFALSADNTNCHHSYTGCEERPASNKDILNEMKKIFSCCEFSDSEICYYETKEKSDDLWKRTMWTVRKSFNILSDLAESFLHLYYYILDVATTMYDVYEEYATNAGIVDYYLERMGFEPGDEDVFELPLTAPAWTHKIFMTEYDRTEIEGFSTTKKVYQNVGFDITSIEIATEIVKAKKPSVFITSATYLEDIEGKLDPDDFEYRQFFSIMEPTGCSRSICHGNDVLARVHYDSLGVYILEPLEIYFGDNNIKYLIATQEIDGSYTFFTDYNSVAAVAEYTEEGFHVLIEYGLKELAPYIASIEELVFEPGAESAQDEVSDEEKRFRLLNEQIREAKKIMRGWVKDDDISLLYSPSINLLTFLKREFPDVVQANQEDNESAFADEVQYVQSIKDRCFGIESEDLQIWAGRINADSRQMEISDFL